MSVIKGYFTSLSSPGQGETVTVTSIPGNKIALDVSIAGSTGTISGNVHIEAPTGPTKVSGATIGVAAVNPLVGNVLANRVSLAFRNIGPGVIYYKEDALVTADDDPVTGGWDINPGENFNIDLDASNAFYLISTLANTKVKFLQIASS